MKPSPGTPVYMNSQAFKAANWNKCSTAQSQSLLSLNNDISTLCESENPRNHRPTKSKALDDRYFVNSYVLDDDPNNNTIPIGGGDNNNDQSTSLDNFCQEIQVMQHKLQVIESERHKQDQILKLQDSTIDQLSKTNQELMEQLAKYEEEAQRKKQQQSDDVSGTSDENSTLNEERRQRVYKSSSKISSSMSNIHSKLLGKKKNDTSSSSKVKSSSSYTAGIATSSSSDTKTPQKLTTTGVFTTNDQSDDNNIIMSIKGGANIKDTTKFWSAIKDKFKSGGKNKITTSSSGGVCESKKSAKRLFGGPKPFKSHD